MRSLKRGDLNENLLGQIAQEIGNNLLILDKPGGIGRVRDNLILAIFVFDVLMQSGSPLAYYSKTLGMKASAMSTYEKEALAIVEALKKWRHYFHGMETLHNILKKNSFHSTAQQIEAFNLLKLKLTTTHVLALPNFKEKFVLETDANGNGIRAVLMLSGSPLAYYSKILGMKASAMSTYEK
ncbi:retrotransposon protein [Hordeum vulgare]|nr:retrotransposon protein [Hordeum vulgare]